MQTMIIFCLQHSTQKYAPATWKTYLGWLGQLKTFATQPKAEHITVAQIEAWLVSITHLSPRSQMNARQAIRAIYYHVLWPRLTNEFRQEFLLRIHNHLKSRHRTGRWKKRLGKLPAPDVQLPTPENCECWLSLLTPGKPQRACITVYAKGLPPHIAATQQKTSVPAMQKALRQARARARIIGINIGTGSGLRAIRCVAILNRIQHGEDPLRICQAVKLRSIASLKPYLRLAGCIK